MYHTLKTRFKYINSNKKKPMQMSSVDLNKGQVSLASRKKLAKTGYVSQETRPKFIDSQNLYFFVQVVLYQSGVFI